MSKSKHRHRFDCNTFVALGDLLWLASRLAGAEPSVRFVQPCAMIFAPRMAKQRCEMRQKCDDGELEVEKEDVNGIFCWLFIGPAFLARDFRNAVLAVTFFKKYSRSTALDTSPCYDLGHSQASLGH